MSQAALAPAKEYGDTVNVSYRLKRKLHTKLRICSFLKSKSQNDIAEAAIAEYLDRLLEDSELSLAVRTLAESNILGK